jgi:hypothetical protein
MSSDAEVCGSKVDGIARPINNLNRENSLLALWEGKLLLSEKTALGRATISDGGKQSRRELEGVEKACSSEFAFGLTLQKV